MNQTRLGLVWGTWPAELVRGPWKVCLLVQEFRLQPGVKIDRTLSELSHVQNEYLLRGSSATFFFQMDYYKTHSYKVFL